MLGGKLLSVVRLCFYTAALAVLAVTAVIVLAIDLTADEDPVIRAYHYTRWKYITCWFNLMLLAYYPLCLYCEWRQHTGDRTRHLKTLMDFRDVSMTSILFPTVMVADIVFWVCFHLDEEFIAPPKLYVYLPIWAQHSMHTLSMFTVMTDIVLTPRHRPKSLLPGFGVMASFVLFYTMVIIVSKHRGELVYSFLGSLTDTKLLAFTSCIYLGYLFFFSIQWHIINYVWSGHLAVKKLK